MILNSDEELASVWSRKLDMPIGTVERPAIDFSQHSLLVLSRWGNPERKRSAVVTHVEDGTPPIVHLTLPSHFTPNVAGPVGLVEYWMDLIELPKLPGDALIDWEGRVEPAEYPYWEPTPPPYVEPELYLVTDEPVVCKGSVVTLTVEGAKPRAEVTLYMATSDKPWWGPETRFERLGVTTAGDDGRVEFPFQITERLLALGYVEDGVYMGDAEILAVSEGEFGKSRMGTVPFSLCR